MPREIWNEGRVVGYSSYEVYVKQHLSEDPTTPPATEREWLASSLAMGTSLLLRVPDVSQAEDAHTYVDIFLPTNSRLAAANTIIATYFDGEADFNLSTDPNSVKCWANKVTSYGRLISNNSSASPVGTLGPKGSVPTQTLADWTHDQKERLKDYMKIYDGITIQPGTWVDNSSKPPQKDFQANLKTPYPRIRLHVKGPLTKKPLILLTGFTIRAVLSGIVGQDTTTDTGSPQDGDFLGPAVFPWANKIMFTVPSSYIAWFASGAYQRTLETPTAAGSKTKKLIKDTAVIDMQASKPETYYSGYTTAEANKYSKNTTNPRYQYAVNQYATLGDVPVDGESVLTVYQRSAVFPPALYGTFVAETGTHYLNPLDVVAPGNVKMFYNDNGTVMKNYEDTYPGTTAINKKSDGTIQIFNDNGDIVDVAGLEIQYLNTGSESDKFESPRTSMTGANRPRVVRIKTGQKSVYALMLSTNIANAKDTLPTQTSIDSKPTNLITLNSSNSNNNISWSALLDALRNNRAIDLLEHRLKSAKETLVRSHGTGTANGPYLEFGPKSDGTELRLVISDKMPNPSNFPVGSIGIGWGFTPED